VKGGGFLIEPIIQPGRKSLPESDKYFTRTVNTEDLKVAIQYILSFSQA
jgi:hypothetical protein